MKGSQRSEEKDERNVFFRTMPREYVMRIYERIV